MVRATVLPAAALRVSWLYALSKTINTLPSLYLEAGAIHGTVLCQADAPLLAMQLMLGGAYLEDGLEGDERKRVADAKKALVEVSYLCLSQR